MTPAKVKKHATTILFTFAVTLVCMSLVSGIALATRAQVELNRTLFLKQGVRQAAGLDATATTDDLLAWTEANVTAIAAPGADADADPWLKADYFLVKDATDPSRTCIVQSADGPGLWGTISALVGFTPDHTTLSGIAFLAHSETPGLGARMDEPWFSEQFKGCADPITKRIAEPEDHTLLTAQRGEMHGITGATITSESIKAIVNKTRAHVAQQHGSEGH